jgi:hypothetical protein
MGVFARRAAAQGSSSRAPKSSAGTISGITFASWLMMRGGSLPRSSAVRQLGGIFGQYAMRNRPKEGAETRVVLTTQLPNPRSMGEGVIQISR